MLIYRAISAFLSILLLLAVLVVAGTVMLCLFIYEGIVVLRDGPRR